MPSDHQAQVRDFHNATGLAAPIKPKLPDLETIKLRTTLIFEESSEFMNSVQTMNGTLNIDQKVEYLLPFADAIADLLYVTYGAAITFGIDIHPVFDAVHDANMRKVRDGVRRRGDGKILKPPGWYGPEGKIRSLLREQIERQVRERECQPLTS